MSTFRIEARSDERRCTLILSGEADIAVADEIERLGTASLAEPSTFELVLDLHDVTFMDSTALGAVIELQNLAKRLQKHFRLARPSARVQRILQVTGLSDAFDVAVESP